jgi:hypothetical protein
MRNILVTAVLVGLCCLGSSAQSGTAIGGRTFAPSQRPFRFEPNRGRTGIGMSGVRFDGAKGYHRYGRDAFFYGGYPYFPPDYEGSYEPVVVSQPQPPVVIPTPPVRQEPVPSAALLELQGNQWVKVSSFSMPSLPAAGISSTAKETPPAILVYRDGHSEELSSYSIIGTTIFAKEDYVATGAPTRKIRIADLDVPATVKQNRDRGVKFDLPSGPNEIILRP